VVLLEIDMKILWVLPILLFIGGCFLLTPNKQITASAVIAPEVASAPAKSPVRTVSGRPSFSVMAVAEPVRGALSETAGSNAETLDDLHLVQTEASHAPKYEGLTLLTGDLAFDFPMIENERVRYYIDYYTGEGREVFTHLLERAERYIPYMRKIFEEEGLPQDLTYLALVESGFNPQAYSWANAAGPWQFIESTGNLYGLSNDWWRDERRDFEKSTRAAARLLGDLHERFAGDWYLAVAAYNAGGGTISRAVEAHATTDFWELSESPSLRTETKNYLPKLLAVLTIAKNPEEYGFTDLNCPGPIKYDLVTIPDVTDLELVAKLCEVSYDEIKALNPELKRWCTPPGVDEYQLRIPTGKRDFFEERYAQIPAENRSNYKRHRIARGDTLGTISEKYHIRVDDIIDLNKIRNPRALRVGSDLILPLHESYSQLPVEEMPDDSIRTRRKSYKVRNGDSLWSIAKRFDVNEKELRAWNKLVGRNLIRPGQMLVVSQKSARSAPGVKIASAATTTPNASRKIIYKVKSGDTLWDISRKHSVSAVQVRSWNNLTEDHVLRPGDKLTLQVHDEYRG
jgi:membrane-bound lytic murein transglycosylase D